MSTHEHFTRQKLKSLTSDEVVEIALSLQTQLNESVKQLSNEIKDLGASLKAEIQSLKSNFNERLQLLESELSISRHVNTQLERRCSQLEQYSRRECLEIRGVPSTVLHEDLVGFLLPIFKKLDVDLTEKENAVQACHRLHSKTDDVIIKFSQREDRNSIIRNRKMLKEMDLSECGLEGDGKIFINENLCPSYKRLVGIANKLYKNDVISSFWTINGVLRIKFNERDPFIIITHIEDFMAQFPGYNFENIFQKNFKFK